MDIEKAIQMEKEYISYRKNGEEPFHLLDAVKECGFSNLAEYFAQKRDYELKQLEFSIVETTPLKAIKDVLAVITEKKTAILFANTESTIVWNGNDGVYDQEYCQANNIPVLPIQTAGGTIVSTSGDLNIGICALKESGLNKEIVLNKFVEIFKKYTDKTVSVDGNDILIDGYKVLGASTYNFGGMFMFITPVSMSDKNTLIDAICIKKSTKTPGYIDFMDANVLRQEVLTWLKK